MTGSAWTRWTLCIEVCYILRGGSLREGRAKYFVGPEAGGLFLRVLDPLFGRVLRLLFWLSFGTSFFDSFLIDF